ncbi:UDP-glycosyltransferase 13-like [Cryptomeria japonica]|uniref:UDP-glycosyltransferase 13-like n=1 Tax=Cryptomeria japonica TaxID=3369 RepID=UPI0027DA9494|nr:UDP-glycosyltransferase 13-like [Cryptomeria japonica]
MEMDEDDSGTTLDWRDIKNLKDLEYRPEKEGEPMVTPGTNNSRKSNPPRWAERKFKSSSRKMQDLEPPIRKKTKLTKSSGSKDKDHKIRLDIPINVDNKEQGTMNKDNELVKRGRSVLYISFGLHNTIFASNMKELALGLESNGQPFIWVVRSPLGISLTAEFSFEFLPDGFEERINAKNQGLVIKKWASQLVILSHPSMGGFVSQCG